MDIFLHEWAKILPTKHFPQIAKTTIDDILLLMVKCIKNNYIYGGTCLEKNTLQTILNSYLHYPIYRFWSYFNYVHKTNGESYL